MKETLPVDNDVLRYAERTRAYPYDWGSSVDEITSALNNDELFDVVVAADCCYMPWLQPKLLDSIQMLMSDRGVALIPFALHGNAADDDVWAIVDRAREKGFHVEVLEPKQLTPPNPGMESKQALVQTVRLTKQ
jgi:predicted nicotinamide N-methyase